MGPERPIAPFLKASCPQKAAVSPEGGLAVSTQSEREIGEEEGREVDTGGGARASPVEVSPGASSSNGLGHHGEPAEPTESRTERSREGEAEGQEEDEVGTPAKIVRAPRTPSQSERELHEAVHLPHAEWCEYCARGRGRNKAHKSRNKRKPSQTSIDIK